jgi:phosphoribosyl 1,2-cyclic phosphodiesterase
MMRITVLASGSRGNSSVISGGRTRILLDAGLSCRELLRRMAQADEDPATLDAILITHEHQDHVAGLGVLARKLRIPVYITEATHRAWVRQLTPTKRMTYADWLAQRKLEREATTVAQQASAVAVNVIEQIFSESDSEIVAEHTPSAEIPADSAEELEAPTVPAALKAVTTAPTYLPAVEHFAAGSPFRIGDLDITPFTIPHDAADPCGFVFAAEGIRIGVATDLGYVPQNVKQALQRLDVLMLESNHDLEMLRDGPYPWPTKQRIMSRVGHLSNVTAAEFLADDYDGHAAYVLLAHLSENNNLPELARLAAEQALAARMDLLGNRLLLAQQAAPLPTIAL